MLTVPLAAVSAVSAITSAIAAEDGAKRAETGDDFATLLGLQVAVAAGESRPAPAIARPALPKGGKGLPVVADAEPKAAEPASPELPATDRPTSLPQIELAALPLEAFALAPPAATEPATMPASAGPAARLVAASPALPTPLAAGGSQPVEAAATLPTIQPENPVIHARSPTPAVQTKPDGGSETPSEPKHDVADKPSSGRPNAAPQFSLPAQASARAVLIHSREPGLTVDPIKSPPVLPERAAAQATIALATRGDHERPARLPQAVTAEALPTDAETQSAFQPPLLRPLKAVLAERAAPADLLPALASAAPEGDLLSVPQAAASAPSALPAPARHDFAAMIDRLIEARDMAGAQPVAMTLRHDDFGAVSLNFQTAGDGLTVTMASPDPEFARAVSVAAASGAASQSDLTRQGGEPAASRQHTGGSTSEDSSGQSRAGSREAERDGSRQRRDQPQPQRNAARQPSRSGIFA